MYFNIVIAKIENTAKIKQNEIEIQKLYKFEFRKPEQIFFFSLFSFFSFLSPHPHLSPDKPSPSLVSLSFPSIPTTIPTDKGSLTELHHQLSRSGPETT